MLIIEIEYTTTTHDYSSRQIFPFLTSWFSTLVLLPCLKLITENCVLKNMDHDSLLVWLFIHQFKLCSLFSKRLKEMGWDFLLDEAFAA